MVRPATPREGRDAAGLRAPPMSPAAPPRLPRPAPAGGLQGPAREQPGGSGVAEAAAARPPRHTGSQQSHRGRTAGGLDAMGHARRSSPPASAAAARRAQGPAVTGAAVALACVA